MRPSLIALVSLPLAALAFACGSSSGGAPPASSGTLPTVINPKVQVATASQVSDATVLSDRLTFPAASHQELLARKPGDILVGAPNAASKSNPYGYLRKVVSVASDGTTITVQTTKAVLNEVVQQGQFKASVKTPQVTIGGSPITLLDWTGQDIFRGAGSVNLAENPPKTLGYDAFATFKKATLSFTPTFDIGANIQLDLSNILGSIQEFHVIATGKLDADVEVETALTLNGTATGDDLAQLIAQTVSQGQNKTLVDYPINLGSIDVGILSIPVNAEFKVTVACDMVFGGALDVTVGAVSSVQVQAGFSYTAAGGVAPVYSDTETLNLVGPTYTVGGAIGAKCTLHPEFDVKFWDIAAAQVWAEPYAALYGSATCNAGTLNGQVTGEAYAGVSATANATIDILGLYQWQKECTLFSVATPIEQVTASFTLPGGSMSTCTPAPSPPLPVNQATPPSMCFGGGSAPPPTTGSDGGTTTTGGNDGGTTTTGGDGGACNITPETPPSGWTCDPSKYGDCVCDCTCGAGDRDCAVGQCSTCGHDVCTTGTPLGLSCTSDGQNGACIQSICANDSYCCEFAWSASCVAHITNGDYACTARTCP